MAKINKGILLILAVITFIILLLNFTSAYNTYSFFNRTANNENLSFSSNSTLIRYFTIPNVTLSTGTINLSGYLNPSAPLGGAGTPINSTPEKWFLQNDTAVTNPANAVDGNYGTYAQMNAASGTWAFANWTENWTIPPGTKRYAANFTYYYYMDNGGGNSQFITGFDIWALDASGTFVKIDSFTHTNTNPTGYVYRGVYVNSSFLTGNKLTVKVGMRLGIHGYSFTAYGQYYDAGVIFLDAPNPYNVNVSLGNTTGLWFYPGIFNLTGNFTDVKTQLNSYLSTCDYVDGLNNNYVKKMCNVPLQVHSDSAGILNYLLNWQAWEIFNTIGNNYANITFSSPVNSTMNPWEIINASSNYVALNVVYNDISYPEINKSSTVTFFNATRTFIHPTLWKTGSSGSSYCTECVNSTRLDAGRLIFTVPNWNNGYYLGEGGLEYLLANYYPFNGNLNDTKDLKPLTFGRYGSYNYSYGGIGSRLANLTGGSITSTSTLNMSLYPNLTVNFWAQVENPNINITVLQFGQQGLTLDNNAIAIGINNGHWFIQGGSNGNSSNDFDTGINADSNKHMHTILYDGSNISWYIDSVLIGTFNHNYNITYGLVKLLVDSDYDTVPPVYCFQETANASTGNDTAYPNICKTLNYSGTYACDLIHWSGGTCYGAYDGDWNTAADMLYNDGPATIWTNYSKPVNANNLSMWTIKHGTQAAMNLTIPELCWNRNPLQFEMISSISGSGNWAACWNGTGWVNLHTGISQHLIYEEAMTWSLTDIKPNMTIDELGIWNRTLFQSDINQLYAKYVYVSPTFIRYNETSPSISVINPFPTDWNKKILVDRLNKNSTVSYFLFPKKQYMDSNFTDIRFTNSEPTPILYPYYIEAFNSTNAMIIARTNKQESIYAYYNGPNISVSNFYSIYPSISQSYFKAVYLFNDNGGNLVGGINNITLAGNYQFTGDYKAYNPNNEEKSLNITTADLNTTGVYNFTISFAIRQVTIANWLTSQPILRLGNASMSVFSINTYRTNTTAVYTSDNSSFIYGQNQTFADGLFHYVTVRVNNRSLEFFIDGIKQDGTINITYADGQVISAFGNATSKLALNNLYIDDLMVFNTSLTDAQIAELDTDFPTTVYYGYEEQAIGIRGNSSTPLVINNSNIVNFTANVSDKVEVANATINIFNLNPTNYSICYQESMNVPNQGGIDGSCGLDYTGYWVKDWTGSNYLTNVFDGNWNTYERVGNGPGTAAYVNITYKKPGNGIVYNATWIIKHFEYSAVTLNFTLPTSCLNYYPDRILLKMQTTGSSDQISFHCYNGAWNQLYTYFASGSAGGYVHEEAINWTYAPYTQTATISTLGYVSQIVSIPITLLDGFYRFFWLIFGVGGASSETYGNNDFILYANYPGVSFIGLDGLNWSNRTIPVTLNIDYTLVNNATATVNLFNQTDILNSTDVTPINGNMYLNFTVLQDGIYYFNATATSLVSGRTNMTSAYVIVDTFAPNVTAIISPPALSNKKLINFNMTLSDANDGIENVSGVKNATVIVTQGISTINITTVDVTDLNVNIPMTLDDGYYNYSLLIYDYAGNSYQTANIALTVDTTYPELTWIAPVDGANITNANMALSVNSVTDSVTIYIFNTSDIVNITTFTPINGTNYINFSLIDGNYQYNASGANGELINWTENRNMLIDSHAPSYDIISPPTTSSLWNNLTSYWNFNEGTGTTLHDSLGKHNGTISGTTWTANGKIGNASMFNGDNNYIEVNGITEPLNNSFSLSIWIYPISIIPSHRAIEKGSNTDWRLVTIDTSSISFRNNTNINSIDIPLSTNEWTFITITFDGITTKGYKNGQLIMSDNNLRYSDDSNTITIGNYGGTKVYAWNGTLDEIGIWNRPLTPNEISALYQNSLAITYNYSGPTFVNTSTMNFTINSSDNFPSLKNATLTIINQTGSTINQTTVDLGSLVQTVITVPVSLIDGFYTWFWNLFDFTGNSPAQINNTIVVDTNNPQIAFNDSLTLQSGVSVPSLNITIETIITESNPVTLTYNLWNSTWSNITIIDLTNYGSQPFPVGYSFVNDIIYNVSNGFYYYNATIVDRINGFATTETRNITTDTVNPIITLLNPSTTNLTIYDETINTFNASLTDATSGLLNATFSIDGTDYVNSYPLGTLSTILSNTIGLDDDTYPWSIVVYDRAGNKANYSGTIAIDTNASIQFDQENPYIPRTGQNLSTHLIQMQVRIYDTTPDHVTYNVWNTTWINTTVISLLNQTVNGSYQPFPPGSSFYNWLNVSIYSDGVYYFNATVTDSANNTGGTETRWATFDITLPNATILNPLDYYLGNESVNFTANITDNIALRNSTFNINGTLTNGSSYNYSTFTDLGTAVQTIVSIPLTLSDGIYNWFFGIYDWASNLFTTQINSNVVDTTSPILDINYPVDGQIYNHTITFANVSLTEYNPQNLTLIDITLPVHLIANLTYYDPAFLTANPLLNINSSFLINNINTGTQGYNNIIVTATDQLNHITVATHTYFLDTIYPNIDFVPNTDYNNSFIDRTSIYYNVTVSDTNLDYTIITLFDINLATSQSTQVNATGQNMTISGVFTGVTQNHDYYLSALTCDIAENCNTTEQRLIHLDNIYPIVNFTSPTPATNILTTAYNDKSIYGNMTVYDIHLNNQSLRLIGPNGYDNITTTSENNLSIFNTTISYNWTGLIDGNYTLLGYAYDKIGHYKSTENRTIYITGNKPSSVTFVSPTPSYGTILPYIAINVSVVEPNMNNITIFVYNSTGLVANASNLNPYQNNFYYQFNLPNGQYSFNATAYDIYGNYNSTTTYTIIKQYGAGNISACRVLDFSGNYYLTQNIGAGFNGSSCITVTQPATTLDCQGYSITSLPTYTSGISISSGNLLLKNCIIDPPGNASLLITGGSVTATNDTFENSLYGILMTGGSLTLSNSLITDNTYGLFLAGNSRATITGEVTFTDDTYGIYHNYTTVSPGGSSGRMVWGPSGAGNYNGLTFTGSSTDIIDLIGSSYNTFTNITSSSSGEIRYTNSSHNTVSKATLGNGGVYLNGNSTANTFHDATYSGTESVESGSELIRSWTTTITTRDTGGNTVGGTTVHINDGSNRTVYTNPSGTIVTPVNQYVNNGTITVFNPYEIFGVVTDYGNSIFTDTQVTTVDDQTQVDLTFGQKIRSTLLSRQVGLILMAMILLIGLAASTGFFIVKMRNGESVVDIWKYFIIMMIWNTVFLVLFLVLGRYVMQFFYP